MARDPVHKDLWDASLHRTIVRAYNTTVSIRTLRCSRVQCYNTVGGTVSSANKQHHSIGSIVFTPTGMLHPRQYGGRYSICRTVVRPSGLHQRHVEEGLPARVTIFMKAKASTGESVRRRSSFCKTIRCCRSDSHDIAQPTFLSLPAAHARTTPAFSRRAPASRRLVTLNPAPLSPSMCLRPARNALPLGLNVAYIARPSRLLRRLNAPPCSLAYSLPLGLDLHSPPQHETSLTPIPPAPRHSHLCQSPLPRRPLPPAPLARADSQNPSPLPHSHRFRQNKNKAPARPHHALALARSRARSALPLRGLRDAATLRVEREGLARPTVRPRRARAPPTAAGARVAEEVRARKGRAPLPAGHLRRPGPLAELLPVRTARAEERPAARTRLVLSWR